MSGFRVPFGLKNGRLVGTDEVVRGLSCGCVCPECGAALEAHKGGQVAHHFAHHTAGNCAYGLETALHLGAKQILLEERQFAVPSLEAFARVTDKDTGISREARKTLPDKLINFDEVSQEVDLGGVVADICATFRGRPLIIEIAVTHFCDEEKIRRLENLGGPAVELDLSHIKPPITMSELRAWVVERIEHKTWLFNPRTAALHAAAKAEASALLQQALTDEVRWTPSKKNWDQKYKTWSAAEKLKYSLQRLRLTEAEIPAYLNHRTRGDRAFACDRQVWQTAVFADFIHGKSAGLVVALSYVAEWLAEGFDLTEPYPNAVKVALWEFLTNLESVGCLERLQGQQFLIHRSSLAAIDAVVDRIRENQPHIDRRAAEGRKLRLLDAWKQPLDRELVWAPAWNRDYAQDAVLECKRVFGEHDAWASLMTTLRPGVRELYPGDFANRYAATAGLNAVQVLRALVLAGFVTELPF